MSSDKTPPR